MPKGKPIEPLDLAEMETNPSLNGMLSFRDVVPVGVRPIGATPVGISPLGPPPVGLAPAAVTDLAAIEAQLKPTAEPLHEPRGKLIQAVKVEDGHSATQNAVYWYLWRAGQYVNGRSSRFIQAGYAQIQAAVGVDRSNIQDTIRELQKKLSVRVLKPATVGTATLYEVFCCEDILAKRKAEGMVWVRKFGTRRADFISNENEPPDLAPIGLRPTAYRRQTHTPGGLTPTGGIGVKPTLLVKEANNDKATSTAPFAEIAQAIREETGIADDSAAAQIFEAVRAGNSEAAPAAIADQVRKELRRLGRIKRVDNPLGLLLSQRGKFFRPPPLAEQGRQVVPAEDEQQRLQRIRAVLEDPDAGEWEKRIAEQIV